MDENKPDNLSEILEKFDLTFRYDRFFDFSETSPVKPDEKFLFNLEFSITNRGEDDKEAFICEFLIVPFLREIWQRHPRLSLFSHIKLKTEEFHLIPDYIVSAKNPRGLKKLHKPLLLTVEAKDEKFDEGWFQALLQLIVCQKLNQTLNKKENIPVYAIVTTGDLWQFGILEEKSFIRHPVSVSIEDPPKLLGILDYLFTMCEGNIDNKLIAK